MSSFKPSSSIRLSAVIITRNEETNIADCLRSVRWVDEIIVIDAQSTDGTAEIARQYTKHVFVRPWPGFGEQKNFGIEQATSDWILIVDSDERVTQELEMEIQKTLGVPEFLNCMAFRIPRKNYFYGKWVRWGGAYPDYQIRLFQKSSARYNDVAIHENLIVNGKIGTLSSPLIHFTERRITDHFQKFNLYTTLAASEKQKTKKVVSWYHFVFNPFVVFFKTYVLKQGFKDGIRGVIFAVLASQYTFIKYTKLFEFQLSDDDTPQ